MGTGAHHELEISWLAVEGDVANLDITRQLRDRLAEDPHRRCSSRHCLASASTPDGASPVASANQSI